METCRICGREVDEDDYCYGCKEYICEWCDVGEKAHTGNDHSWEDHNAM